MRAKQLIKSALVSTVEKSGAEWLRDRIWELRGCLPVAILLFHRITDAIPEDGITISTERFRETVKTVKERYRPISLTKLVEHIEQGTAWKERTVVVTFDDGYQDNYDFAAPILLQHEVPATFFVTVSFIGTDQVLPWDEHLRGRIGWMDWSHIRDLHARGFQIGSHTLTHCDLGKERGARAWSEIYESRLRLEDALGANVSLFAYPFGRPENITQENRNLIREAGYKCCCSGFGGFVTARSDLFDMPRIGINNWFATASDLHFEIRIIAPWRWFTRQRRAGRIEPHAARIGGVGVRD